MRAPYAVMNIRYTPPKQLHCAPSGPRNEIHAKIGHR
jgi:hypothetical protein